MYCLWVELIDPKAVLSRQHILTNPGVLKSIVEKADMRESDTVLEIGPGTGNLTLELLQAAHRVIAVEIDPRMIEVVHKRIKGTEMAQRLEVSSNFLCILFLHSFTLFTSLTICQFHMDCDSSCPPQV